MTPKTIFILLGILIIATFLRVYDLKTAPPGLYPDEAMNGSDALEALHTGDFKVFYPENNGREGLFINIQALFVAVLGNEPWVLRLPSAIFGILTVLGLFFLGRELFLAESGERRAESIGLLASFFLATSFWHINFSRIGFRAITASFFLIWAVYFFLRSLSSLNLSSRGMHRGISYLYAAWAGLFFGLGFYSYIAYRVMPLLFLLFIPFFRRVPGFWKLVGIFIFATFVVAAPLGWYFLQNPADFFGRTTQVAVTASENPAWNFVINVGKTIGMLNFAGDYNWRHNYAGRPELFWPVGILFWIGVLLLVIPAKAGIQLDSRPRLLAPERSDGGQVRGNDSFPSCLLFSWLALAILPVALSSEGLPHALRAILMIPPVMILAAVGGVWMYERVIANIQIKNNIRIAKIFSFVFLALLVYEAYHTYFVLWAKHPEVQGAFAANYVEIANQIRALPNATPKYVIVEAGGVPVPVPGADRQIPMPTQTVMYLTDSWSAAQQEKTNIHYVLPGEETESTAGAAIFYIR